MKQWNWAWLLILFADSIHIGIIVYPMIKLIFSSYYASRFIFDFICSSYLMNFEINTFLPIFSLINSLKYKSMNVMSYYIIVHMYMICFCSKWFLLSFDFHIDNLTVTSLRNILSFDKCIIRKNVSWSFKIYDQ